MHPQDMLSVLHGFLLFLLFGSSGAARRGVSTSSGQAVDFDCPEEFGYYPHPTDCTQYYVCVFGGALLESCTGGLMYSHELQTCDWPRNVGCGDTGDGGTISTVRVTDPRTRLPPQLRSSSSPQQGLQQLGRVSQREDAARQRQIVQPVQEEEEEQSIYEDELGPAEETESDRQQRVYRGQPSTLGQVQRDRDGLRSLPGSIQSQNAIPQELTRQDKLQLGSYASQRTNPLRQQQNIYSDPTCRPMEDFDLTNLTWYMDFTDCKHHYRIKRQASYRLAGRYEKIPVILIPSNRPAPSFTLYGGPRHQQQPQQQQHHAPTSYSSHNDDNFHIVHKTRDFLGPSYSLGPSPPQDSRPTLDLIKLTKETIQSEFRPVTPFNSYFPNHHFSFPTTSSPFDLSFLYTTTQRPYYVEVRPPDPPVIDAVSHNQPIVEDRPPPDRPLFDNGPPPFIEAKPPEEPFSEVKQHDRPFFEKGPPPFIEDKPPERPFTEVKPLEQPFAEVKPLERPFAEVKPKERPFAEVKSKERPFSEVKPKERPFAEVKPKEWPFSEVKPKEKPFSEVKPKERPFSEVKSQERPIIENNDPPAQPQKLVVDFPGPTNSSPISLFTIEAPLPPMKGVSPTFAIPVRYSLLQQLDGPAKAKRKKPKTTTTTSEKNVFLNLSNHLMHSDFTTSKPPSTVETSTKNIGHSSTTAKSAIVNAYVSSKNETMTNTTSSSNSGPELDLQTFNPQKINKNDPRFYVPETTVYVPTPTKASTTPMPKKSSKYKESQLGQRQKPIPEEYYENFKPFPTKKATSSTSPISLRPRLRPRPTVSASYKSTTAKARNDAVQEQIATTPEPSISSRYNASARSPQFNQQYYQLYDDGNFYRDDYNPQQVVSSTLRTPAQPVRGQAIYQEERPTPAQRGQSTYQGDVEYRGHSQDLYSPAPIAQDFNDQYSVQVDEQDYQHNSQKQNRSEEVQADRRKDTVSSDTISRRMTVNESSLTASDVNYVFSPPPRSIATYLTPPPNRVPFFPQQHAPRNKQVLEPPKNGGVLAKSLNNFENILSNIYSAVSGRQTSNGGSPQTILRSEIGRIPHVAPVSNASFVKAPVIYQELPERDVQTFFVEIEPKRPRPSFEIKSEPVIEITREKIVNPESEEVFTHVPYFTGGQSSRFRPIEPVRPQVQTTEASGPKILNFRPSEPVRPQQQTTEANGPKILNFNYRRPAEPPIDLRTNSYRDQPQDLSDQSKYINDLIFPSVEVNPANERRPALEAALELRNNKKTTPLFRPEYFNYRTTTPPPTSMDVDSLKKLAATEPAVSRPKYRILTTSEKPVEADESVKPSNSAPNDGKSTFLSAPNDGKSTFLSDESLFDALTQPRTTSTTQRPNPYAFIIVSTETPAPFTRHVENEHRNDGSFRVQVAPTTTTTRPLSSRGRNRYDIIRQHKAESLSSKESTKSVEPSYAPEKLSTIYVENEAPSTSTTSPKPSYIEIDSSLSEEVPYAPIYVEPESDQDEGGELPDESPSNEVRTTEEPSTTTTAGESRKGARKVIKIHRSELRNQKLQGAKVKRIRKPPTTQKVIEFDDDADWSRENHVSSTIKPIIVDDELDVAKNNSRLRFTIEDDDRLSENAGIVVSPKIQDEMRVVRPAYQPINLGTLESAEEPIPPTPSVPKESQRKPDHERTPAKHNRGKSSLKPRLRASTATPDSESSVSRTPPLRLRGGSSSMHGGGNDVTINRGTPAPSRGTRPTLKPSTAIVTKSSEAIDIYRNPPARPRNLYPTPIPDKAAAKCRKDVCLLPDCSCGGKEIPGGYSAEEIPQLVLLTFDDSVNDLNKGLYSDLFERGRVNPNGCPISATFYVSHEWTDYAQVQNLYANGHEIASHTVSHSFGEQFSQKKWTREIAGQREILSAYGGVKLEDVRGMRAPFLAIGGNKMFKMLYDSNFTYDSSMPIYENRPPSWPYTLDYKVFHDCMIPPCPTKSYPGVWEVPMVMWQDLNGGRCSMGDACSNPPTADGVYKMLIKNFERHFTTNRSPFGLYYHAAWFTHEHHKEGFIAFLDTIVNMPEVWLVTNWQAIQWIRDPQPLSTVNNFPAFQCNEEKAKKCSNPKVCNLWHKSGVRYMRTCQPCPEVYPWTGKTGVRNSRVDNEIIDE